VGRVLSLGAGDLGSIQRGSETGAGVEMAGNGLPVRTELQQRGYDCEARGVVRVEEPVVSASPCHVIGDRRREPT